MKRIGDALNWVEAHVPAWLKIVGFVAAICWALIKFGGDYREARDALVDIPIRVDRLEAIDASARLEALEARRDSVTAALREIRDALATLNSEVGSTAQSVDLAVCLVRVQLGERRPLDCR